eukprot:8013224-Pyramimonas_sp.AAC.1
MLLSWTTRGAAGVLGYYTGSDPSQAGSVPKNSYPQRDNAFQLFLKRWYHNDKKEFIARHTYGGKPPDQT